MKNKLIELSRIERDSICGALNARLMQMSADCAKSCDAGKPNAVLLHEHGKLMRLRDKMLTGWSAAQLDAAAQRAAEQSEAIAA